MNKKHETIFEPALEPKREYLYETVLPEELGIQSYLVKNLSKPKLIGLNKWSDITIEIYDVITPSTSRKVQDFIEICKKRKSIFKPNKTLFSFKALELDPTGIAICQWDIDVYNMNVDFGNFNYSSSELSTIKLIVKPKNCKFSEI